MGNGCFTRWFAVDRKWSGQLISINIKHHSLVMDFRRDWIADVMNPTPA